MSESCHTSRMREICTSGSQEGRGSDGHWLSAFQPVLPRLLDCPSVKAVAASRKRALLRALSESSYSLADPIHSLPAALLHDLSRLRWSHFQSRDVQELPKVLYHRVDGAQHRARFSTAAFLSASLTQPAGIGAGPRRRSISLDGTLFRSRARLCLPSRAFLGRLDFRPGGHAPEVRVRFPGPT